ncbi:MAG: AarF/ABC1/UbiB kinase family protein [Candidatus Thermoplasmatota archaeon]|nr:AarF/ABC1/UbiB kinase family protein [Candidatus Thermoplasmatota archaeon]MDA8142642.1 AarF/ABC1/UbiB kinase family protein [Thermoplasmatales archaeon]
MSDEVKPPGGLRRAEIKVFLRLYPVFRRYLRDRERARKEAEPAWNYARERNGKKALETFISLGPTFIKLGQVLSARPDLLPGEYISSFQKLQDEVPPAPFNLTRPILERNLGKLEEVFEEFDENPVSGASLGQVYLATYRGKKVAVKVNRPDIETVLRKDLLVIGRLLKLARGRIDRFLYISVSNVIEDFNSRIYDEIDYRKESANSVRIAKNIKGHATVIVPEVITELSGKEVLVLEYIRGTKITNVEELRKHDIDLKDLAFRIDILFMRMLLRNDIFHADPHPGNISVSDDGKIILYDFGMIGTLDEKTKFSLLSLYDGLVNTDPDEIIDALLAMGALSPVANRALMRKSMEMAIASFHGKNPEEAEINELFQIANEVIFEFPFRLPRPLVLYMRMSSLLEGICLQLDPEFKFVRVLRQLLYREGMLDELYRHQLSEFARKAIKSIEKGLDVLPLLKKKLEDDLQIAPARKDRKIPASIFLGTVLLSSIFVLNSHPLISMAVMVLDLAGFGYVLLKK